MARLGLQQVLSAGTEIEVTGSVGTILDAEHLPASTPTDVVLAGCDVPDMDGVEGIGRLLTRFNIAKVVLLGDEASATFMTTALRHGADGYLTRDISAEALVRAVRSVAQGEVAVPRSLVHLLVNALRIGGLTGANDDLFARLSARERDVLTEIVRGRSNTEIAARLGLKESTVKTHVSSILRKTGARSRFALQSIPSSDTTSA